MAEIDSFDTGASSVTSGGEAEGLTSVDVDFSGISESDLLLEDFTIREVTMTESLLTPGLQTAVKFQSFLHNMPPKNFDKLKGVDLNITIKRPILGKFGYKEDMKVSQILYRMGGRSAINPLTTDNRKMVDRAVEELSFHACDITLLNNQMNLVSKSWKCIPPSFIVNEVLRSCTGAKRLNIEPSDPPRDYIAENIHPFQVVSQQANAALAGGNDPSFVHFMTYENMGTHHFRSLKTMCGQSPIIELEYSNNGKAYMSRNGIMNYVFPCDFDILSDIMNGVGENGDLLNSLALFNPAIKLFALLGNQSRGCGIGGAVHKVMKSNFGSAIFENSCDDFLYLYAQKRQGRMVLLERDKVALRLTVPWNTIYNVGKVIRVKFKNEGDETRQAENYGSGTYLISSLVHNIRAGGYSTITMDCVATTAGKGIV
jgi:hypothetical protein